MSEEATLYPEAWNRFAQALEAEGFARVEHPFGRWEGDLQVDWDDPVQKLQQQSTHRIAVALDSGFPFKKPEVIPLGDLQAGARHRAPLRQGGALCLYGERKKGWLPEYTGGDLLVRTKEWFVHYHRDDWATEDRPPDLHLYYHRLRRGMLAVTGDDWPPPSGASGRFLLWEGKRVLVASNPVESPQMPAGPAPERLITSLEIQAPGPSVGIWFRMRREPDPSENLWDVLSDVDAKSGRNSGSAQAELRQLVGIKLRREFRMILALGYPGVGEREEWLFLDTILPSAKRRADQWERRLKGIRVRSLETAPAASSDLVRRTGHTASQLVGKQAIVFGLGAIGSSVTLLLAKAGLSHIVGVDGDQLRPGNCIRHEAGLRLVGLDKATAMALEVHQHAPDCHFTTHPVTWDPATLARLAESTDLVIDATANEAFSLLLNEVCVKTETRLLVGAAYRRASVGRIRLIRPRDSACLVCYLQHETLPEYPVILQGDEGEFVEGGCGDPTVEASALDVDHIANVVARIAFTVLTGEQPDGTQCLVVNSPLHDARAPLDTVGIHWAAYPSIHNCEACGSP